MSVMVEMIDDSFVSGHRRSKINKQHAAAWFQYPSAFSSALLAHLAGKWKRRADRWFCR